MLRTSRALATLLLTVVFIGAAEAGPIAVRYLEGVTRAFPVLRSLDGERIAHGDFVQVPRGDRVESRMTFRFKDGSLYEEMVVYSQADAFRLLSYRIVQRGPSFPETIDATVDRETGRYFVRYKADEDSAEEVLQGTYEMPEDAYNGMLSLVLKNLSGHTSETVTLVAFTPKPRAVKMLLLPVAEERVVVSDMPLQTVRYALRPQLGLFASVLVVDIPDVRVWIAPGDAPAFVRAEGPLYFMGPVWRIDPF